VSLESQITEYTIDPFPEDHRNGHHWRVQIQRGRDGAWTIHHAGYWLQPDRTWYPDQRTAVRFGDEHDAISRAQEALRNLDVNGVTFADMRQRWGAP